VFDEFIMKSDLTTKCALLGSIEIAISGILENAEPSINSTKRGIVMDLSEV
jgi:hypothetical protein